MDFFVKNRYTVEIISADPAGFLGRLTEAGISMYDITTVDRLTVRMGVSNSDLRVIKDLSFRLGYEVKIIQRSGPASLVEMIKRRLVLLMGIAAIVFLTLFIPTRVLFVSVEGNAAIASETILEQADRLGISFGASRKYVRSERMKNALLQAVPGLKWAGINTYGCTAVISVVERDNAQQPEAGEGVQGIYATKDGIVSSITVTKGQAVCKPGQAVTQGQLLVSGYTDCGIVTRAEQAEAEVRAVTQHRISAIAPVCAAQRSGISDTIRRWGIEFGKKRIKLYIDSGNSTTGCGKLYETVALTLPGGFRLPVSLIKETILVYEHSEIADVPDADALRRLADSFVSGRMVAGKILRAETSSTSEQNASLFSGVYICDEMIGKLQNEEIR